MAGLFGLFGGKKKEAQPSQPKDAFFLDPDSAKTFGDIDYMRKSKIVRKTFPKTLSNKEGGELIQEVSSMKMTKKNPNQLSNSSSDSNITFSDTFSSSPSFASQNRKIDTNMDMFRNMAKKIKK